MSFKMNESRYLRWLWRIIRLGLGGVFIYASFDKIRYPDQFAQAVYNYHLLPDFLVNAFAVFLPWLELVSGLFLCLGLFEIASITIINLLLVRFYRCSRRKFVSRT